MVLQIYLLLVTIAYMKIDSNIKVNISLSRCKVLLYLIHSDLMSPTQTSSLELLR